MTGAVANRLADQVEIVEAEVSVTVAGSFEDLAEVWEEWDEFVEDVGSDIYFTLDWLQVWWSHYGTGRELRCFVIRQGRTMVAALPFCITKLRIGPITVRLARWVGADSTLSVLHPAITAGYETAALDVVCRHLLGDERCDAVSLHPLSGLSPLGNAVQEFCSGEGAYSLLRDDDVATHIVIPLPDSFEVYLAKLSKQARRSFRKDVRQLSKCHTLRHQTISVGDMGDLYEAFVTLHEAQWRATGRLGHFGDWPGSRAFNRDLIANLAKKGQVRFYLLQGGENVISMRFGFLLGDRYYARLAARRTGPEIDTYGIGNVGLVKMVESLISEGGCFVEAGQAHYEHKLRYGGTEYPLRRQVFTRRVLPARVRAGLLLLWSDAIDIVYYRIWFLKLSPMLRIARPLSQFWIRTRL